MLRVFPPADNLTTEWRPDIISRFLSVLTPAAVRIDILSPKFTVAGEGTDTGTPLLGVELTQAEPWFGTRHLTQRISEGLQREWEAVGPHPGLHLPARNPFIPSEFGLRSSEVGVQSVPVPTLAVSGPRGRVWWRPDTLFQLPRSLVYMFLYSTDAFTDPVALVLSELFGAYVSDGEWGCECVAVIARAHA